MTFLLEIITPERVAFSDTVEMVTAPTTTGTIGILPGHVPLFTSLVEGEIKIVKSGEELFLAIGSGFLEVTHDKTVILVTSAFHAKELSEQEILSAIKRAKDALSAKPTGEALIEAQALFKRSIVALKILRRKRGAGATVGPPPVL